MIAVDVGLVLSTRGPWGPSLGRLRGLVVQLIPQVMACAAAHILDARESFPAMLGHWRRSHLVLLSGLSVLCFSSVFRAVWMCDSAFVPLYYTSRLLYLYDATFSGGFSAVDPPCSPFPGYMGCRLACDVSYHQWCCDTRSTSVVRPSRGCV